MIYAQVGGGPLDGLRFITQTDAVDYLPILGGLLVVVIVFHVVALVLRRAGRSKSVLGGVSMGFDDLQKMRAKGLLTPEEEKRARQALSRQFLERQSEEAEPTDVSTLPLLAARRQAETEARGPVRKAEAPRSKPAASAETTSGSEDELIGALTSLRKEGKLSDAQIREARLFFARQSGRKAKEPLDRSKNG